MGRLVSALDQVKQAVAKARSRGPVSPDRALKMAERAAELDDSEGLGEFVESKQYDKDYWEGLELAWNIILRMRELGHHFRLSWNAYAEKMDVTFIEADKPRNERRQFRGRDEDPYEAVHEAMIESWGDKD